MENTFEQYLKEAMDWDNGADRGTVKTPDWFDKKIPMNKEDLLNKKYKDELLSLAEELRKKAQHLNIKKILSFGDSETDEEIEDYLEDIFDPIRSSIRQLKAFK